jgi:PAS domain-containing protein
VLSAVTTRSRWLAVFGIVIVIIGSLIVWRALRPRTLADDAESVMLAIWRGDSSRLLNYIYPREVELFGWTPAKLSVLIKDVIQKNYGGFRGFRITRKYVNSPYAPSQGTCEAEVIKPDGSIETIDVSVYATDDGGKLATYPLVCSSWHFKYLDRKASTGLADVIAARIRGYDEDKKVLGILGDFGPYDPFDTYHSETRTWEEWRDSGIEIAKRYPGSAP